MKRRYILRCRDAKTYRSNRRLISQFFAEHTDPSITAALLIELAVSITIEWPRLYGVAFPNDRAEWDVVTIDEAPEL